jgi:hypothetical protein
MISNLHTITIFVNKGLGMWFLDQFDISSCTI